GVILVDCLARLERLFGPGAPYMLWIHQRPTTGDDWPAAHLHLHLAPAQRAPGLIRHLAAAGLGAGVFFDPVDPQEAAAQLRSAQLRSGQPDSRRTRWGQPSPAGATGAVSSSWTPSGSSNGRTSMPNEPSLVISPCRTP